VGKPPRSRARVEVTVAVATVDRPDSLRRCVDAIIAGTVQPREIVVVDQGRDARSRSVVDDRDDAGVPIRYVDDPGSGLSASRNAALAVAETAVVATTDDDCVPSPGWLAAIAEAFANSEPPVAVTGPVLPLGPESDGYAVSSRTGTERIDFRGRPSPWLVGTGANVAVQRDWAARIGGYDARLGVGTRGAAGEDLDFIYRLLRAGAHVRYEPEAVVYHERQSKARRRATRTGYGRGVGACCALWLRGGDPGGVVTLGRWLAMRGGLLGRAALRRDWESIEEELLVLGGTARGLGYGLVAPRASGRAT
jgi:GT2 family glycosyltransferase